MPISTSLPIDLGDVCLEIYGSSNTSGKSLNQCFLDATGTFDQTYYSTGVALLEFRGYDHSGGGSLNAISCYKFSTTLGVPPNPCRETFSPVTIYSSKTTLALAYATNTPVYADSEGKQLMSDHLFSESSTVSVYFRWESGAWFSSGTC
jgi:hypothetical protein